jgi:hypothetical protein
MHVMIDYHDKPDFPTLATYISQRYAALRLPYQQWAYLARLAIQHLPYNERQLDLLANDITRQRTELHRAILFASEHFCDELLDHIRTQAHMSKYAWKSFYKNQPITLKNGFHLLIF